MLGCGVDREAVDGRRRNGGPTEAGVLHLCEHFQFAATSKGQCTWMRESITGI